jgi:hypothetical protein
MYVTQRAKSRAVLDQFQEHFGGLVTVRDTKVRNSENWAEQADWHIHKRPEIEAFCRAVQPYVLVKAAQVAIMLEYVTDFIVSPMRRDDLGRVHGMALIPEEVARRERLRLALKVVNAKGPERTEQIVHPPRSAVRVARLREVVPNPRTVSRGEGRYNAKLTEEKVRAIRTAFADGVSKAELSRRYGVSWPAIHQIVTRFSWKYLT